MTQAVARRSPALQHRVDLLEEALRRGGDRIPAPVAADVRRSLTAVRERLALGVDHTVVALVGGTGSGKSSLFNALSGLRFADVGARRPTTSEVTACTWGDAAALLDWLGVTPERRIERESALDGDTQADLRGLVLLDLPDHDSVAAEHRAVVDRLLPMVDLLVWVVDPQKYADDALHTGYLRHLVGHEGSMLLVLNQVDTIPLGEQGTLLRDVSRLVAEDGLTDVPVHAVSARTGDGVPVLRGALARSVAGRGQAEVRAEAELDDAAVALASAVATHEPGNLPRDATVEQLLDALGAHAAADVARRGGEPELGGAQPERVAEVRRSWLDQVSAALPAPWRASVDQALPDDDALAGHVAQVVGGLEPPAARLAAARAWRAGAAVLALVALVLLGATIGTAVGSGGLTGQVVTVAVGLVLVAAAAGACLVMARRATAAAHQQRASDLLAALRAGLATLVEQRLAEPTGAVLADHRVVRRATTTSGRRAHAAAGAAQHAPAGPGGEEGRATTDEAHATGAATTPDARPAGVGGATSDDAPASTGPATGAASPD